MTRAARIIVPGVPHHVTQRGNRGMNVFESDADRKAYLRFLKRYSNRYGLDVWGYCLMTNHIHLVVVPQHETALSNALRDTHTVYAMYFNSRTQSNGHVWQGRFYSCPLDDAHLWVAMRYVELNPVRAGMVDCPENYPWSSAAAHCGLRSDPLLTQSFPPPDVDIDWKAWLYAVHHEDTNYERIRNHTRTGRPCGTDSFVAKLETLLKRTLRPKKGGRPRKVKK